MRHAREAMDPSVSAFLTRFETKIEAAIDGLTKAQQSTATKIDDLLSWRPDLERRVADLSDAVAVLQEASPALPKEGGDNHSGTAPLQQPATLGALPDSGAGATDLLHGSDDHGVANQQREPPPASFMTPPPLPNNGQITHSP